MKEKRTLRWQTGKAHRPPPWVLTTTLASGPGRAEITDQGVFPFHPLAKPGRSLGACCFAQLPADQLRKEAAVGVGLVTTRQYGSPPGSQSPSEFPPGNRQVLGHFLFNCHLIFLDFQPNKTLSQKSINGRSVIGPHSILWLQQKLLSEQ